MQKRILRITAFILGILLILSNSLSFSGVCVYATENDGLVSDESDNDRGSTKKLETTITGVTETTETTTTTEGGDNNKKKLDNTDVSRNADLKDGIPLKNDEKTLYDSYINFDDLMKEERGSIYRHSAKNALKFQINEDMDEICISINYHGAMVKGGLELLNSEGNKVPAEFEYLPGEILIHTRGWDNLYTLQGNVPSKGSVTSITGVVDGEYTEEWKREFQEEFQAFGFYSIDDEVHRTLNKKDNITVPQLERMLKNYPLIPNNSLLKKEGVAEAFIRVQNEYNVSAIGLLAIACLESAYGTSRIAREKQNLFGWGAYDSNPYDGAWDWSDLPTDEAIYKAVKLIAENYLRGKYGQSTYFKMRYNTSPIGQPIHQYCTSKTWIYSNAKIRAQIEVYMGLRD